MPAKEEDHPTRIPFERWKEGDDDAFAALHARFTPLLRARLRRHPQWPALARHFELDDVLQEVWARAVPASRTSFRNLGPGSLLAFLGKIADRALVDIARRHLAKRRGGGGVDALATGFDTPDVARPGRSAPDTPTGNARLAELTAIARAELGTREYDAWELVEMQQFSAEEAALALRCSGSAVRGLILRARTKLVARLGRDAGGGPPNAPTTSCDSDGC